MNTNGVIFYEDDNIVGILTGLSKTTANDKTGAMIQSYILVKDVNPMEAVNTGADALVCGDCKLRGVVVPVDDTKDKKSYSVRNNLKTINRGRKCYVTLVHAPYIIWKAYKKGLYPYIHPNKLAMMLRFRMVRVGSYGDPSVIPTEVWDKILRKTLGRTGYTHQWKNCDTKLSNFTMASVDNLQEKRLANRLGFRTFRIRQPDEPLESDEVACLSDKVARKGKKLVPCSDCHMCNGKDSKVKINIAIIEH